MFRRWGFFLLTNFLVMVTISIVLNVLGVRSYLNGQGIDYYALLVFCVVWGMGGSIISLLLSRFMAKKMTRMTVINPQDPGQYRWIVECVHRLARTAKLPAMPEVGVYPADEVNAFATGPSKSRSLVAVSQGLLRSMNNDEIEGVLAHEVAHIQNGDMVTMTLIQGVVNAFSMFLARVIAFAITTMQGDRDSEDRGGSPFMHGLIVFVLDIVFSSLGLIAISYFSRQREFRADRGSARLSGTKAKMIGALQALDRTYGGAALSQEESTPALAAFKISSKKKGGWRSLFMTHPPLEKRIRALENSV
jgi:heat shock protein HtpX